MSPTSRERDNARRRQDEWSARQALARDASLRRRRTVVTVVAGIIALALVTVMAVSIINGGTAQDSADAPAAPSTPAEPAGTPSGCPEPPAAPAAPPEQASAPDPAVAQDRTWTGTIATSCGDLGVELDGAAAPAAVASFVSLSQAGFFENTPCHRVVTEGIYVLQCGDPTGTGTGGPGYEFGPVENAPADDVYPEGALAMARQGGNGDSMGSQFFIVYRESTIPSDQAGGYTVFGKVTSGLDVVTKIAGAGVDGGGSDGPPADPISLEKVTLQ